MSIMTASEASILMPMVLTRSTAKDTNHSKMESTASTYEQTQTFWKQMSSMTALEASMFLSVVPTNSMAKGTGL